jgi:hypothetical protein
MLKRGFVLVGSVSTTDGKFGTIKAGPLLSAMREIARTEMGAE